MEDPAAEERGRRGQLKVNLTSLFCYQCHEMFPDKESFTSHTHPNDDDDDTSHIEQNQEGEFIQFKIEVESEAEEQEEEDTNSCDPLTMDHEHEQTHKNDSIVGLESEADTRESFSSIHQTRKRRGSSRTVRQKQKASKRPRSLGTSKLLNLNLKGIRLDINDTNESAEEEEENQEELVTQKVKHQQKQRQAAYPKPRSEQKQQNQEHAAPPPRRPLKCLENLDDLKVNCETCNRRFTSLKLFMQHLYSETREPSPEPSINNNKNNRNSSSQQLAICSNSNSGNRRNNQVEKEKEGITVPNFCTECNKRFRSAQIYDHHMKHFHGKRKSRQKQRVSEDEENSDDYQQSGSPLVNSNSNNSTALQVYDEEPSFLLSGDDQEEEEENENEIDSLIQNHTESGSKRRTSGSGSQNCSERTVYARMVRKQLKGRFPCSLCDKTFPYKCSLNRHMMCHSRDSIRQKKQYICVGCDHKFKGKLDLSRHMGTDFNCPNPELKVCTYEDCGASYLYKCALRNHLREHRGHQDKDFKCRFKNCQKSFYTKKELDNHIVNKGHKFKAIKESNNSNSNNSSTTNINSSSNSSSSRNNSNNTKPKALIAKKSTASSSASLRPRVIKSESLAPKPEQGIPETFHNFYDELMQNEQNLQTFSTSALNSNYNNVASSSTSNTKVNDDNNESTSFLDLLNSNSPLMDDTDDIDDAEISEFLNPDSSVDENSQNHDLTEKTLISTNSPEKVKQDSKVKANKEKKYKDSTTEEEEDDDKGEAENESDKNGEKDGDKEAVVKKQKCKKCGKAFKFQCHLRRHMFTHLVTTTKKDLRCPGCRYLFTVRENHRQHVFMNELPASEPRLKCPFEDTCADLSYGYKCALKTHLKTHIAQGQKVKPHKCRQCWRAFRSAYDLKKHEKVHEKRNAGLPYRRYRPSPTGPVGKKSSRSKRKSNKFSSDDDDHDDSGDSDNSSLDNDPRTPQTPPAIDSPDPDNKDNNNPDNNSVLSQEHEGGDEASSTTKRKFRNRYKELSTDPKHKRKRSKYAMKPRNVTCDICAKEGIVKAFKFKCHLQRHILTHKGLPDPNARRYADLEKKFECSGCKRRFVFQRELFQHQALHTIVLEDGNGENSNSKQGQNPNEGEGGGGGGEGGETPGSNELRPALAAATAAASKRTLEDGTVLTNFRCMIDNCQEEFQLKCALQIHTKEHKKKGQRPRPFRCNFEGCNLRFYTRYDMGQHAKRHSVEKPYLCPLCGKGLRSSQALDFHVLNHEGEQAKPFKCDEPGCNRSFVNHQRLHQHKQTVHLGIRAYLCNECGASFKQPGNLSTHMLTHSSHKQYSCDYCDHRFHTKGQMTEHIRKHVNQRTYKCEYCQAAFNARSTLRRHLFTHTGQRPCQCPHCPKNYPENRSLKRHLLRHAEGGDLALANNQSTSGGAQNNYAPGFTSRQGGGNDDSDSD